MTRSSRDTSGEFDPRFGMAGWQLIRAGRHLGQSGLVVGAEGNLSCRLPTGEIMITPAGLRKAELLPDDLVIISAEGSIRRGHRRPSSELALHCAVYATREDAGAVVHAHPIGATAFAASERIPTWTAMPESRETVGQVALAPYALPGSPALGESLIPYLAESSAILLAHHGAVTIGTSVNDALQRMELLERLCQIECAAANLGGLMTLS